MTVNAAFGRRRGSGGGTGKGLISRSSGLAAEGPRLFGVSRILEETVVVPVQAVATGFECHLAVAQGLAESIDRGASGQESQGRTGEKVDEAPEQGARRKGKSAHDIILGEST